MTDHKPLGFRPGPDSSKDWPLRATLERKMAEPEAKQYGSKHRQIPEVRKTYHARLVRLRDADTVIVAIDHKPHHELGWEETVAIRLLEIDTPERDEKEAWVAANKTAREWFIEAMHGSDQEWPLVVEKVALEKFGRTLGYLWRTSDGASLSDYLIELGHSERIPVKVHLDRLGASPIHDEEGH